MTVVDEIIVFSFIDALKIFFIYLITMSSVAIDSIWLPFRSIRFDFPCFWDRIGSMNRLHYIFCIINVIFFYNHSFFQFNQNLFPSFSRIFSSFSRYSFTTNRDWNENRILKDHKWNSSKIIKIIYFIKDLIICLINLMINNISLLKM